MLASLLACSPPLLVVLLDLLLPSLLLSASAAGPGFSASAVADQLRTYRFRSSLVDLPILSAARSLVLLCFYLCWSGKVSQLGVATLCGAASAGYVSLKAVAMFGAEDSPGKRQLLSFRGKERPTVEVLFLSSVALAMAHVLAAYRTSCRERRKQLVYKIDIEAVSAYSVDLSNYHKIALS